MSGKSTFTLQAETDNGTNYFSPTIVEGTAGQKVTLTITNTSNSVKHNFTIESQNINKDLTPGSEVTVTVTFPQSGTLEFFCEYHRSLGMAGELSTS